MAAKSKSAEKIKPPKAPKSGKKKAGKPSENVELTAAHATIAKLRRTVEKLEKNVEKLEKKTSELKAEATSLRAAAASSVKKAKAGGTKKAKKVKETVEAAVHHEAPAAEPAVPPAAPAPVATEVVPVAEAPTSDLTVAQLRAAAREQGVPGYSRLRKDQLIAALS